MYGIEFPDAGISKTFTKVFFTRPDLNLFQSNTKSTKLLDYIDLDLSIDINSKLYSYLLDYLNKVVLEVNAVKYKIESTRQIKCNTIVS